MREDQPRPANDGDPLPIDMSLLASTTFVGEVVMKAAVTPFLRAARDLGCETQVGGVDMLFGQVSANLEFLGFGTATLDEVRTAGLRCRDRGLRSPIVRGSRRGPP